MKFAGIMKNSTVDYPGKIVATLFTGGCNFRCEYCHNSSLINAKQIEEWIEESEVFQYLDKRKKVLDGICITGGEPSLYSAEIVEFVKKVKKRYGNDFLIKIDSNGSNPEFIELICGYVDYIAIDYKSLDYSGFSRCNLRMIEESIEKLKKKAEYEIRITMYPEYIREEDFNKIAYNLKGVRKVAIQQFKPENVFIDKGILPYSIEVLEKFKKVMEREGIEVEIRK